MEMQRINEQMLDLITGGCYCYCKRQPIVPVDEIEYLGIFKNQKKCPHFCGNELYLDCYDYKQSIDKSDWETDTLVRWLKNHNPEPLIKGCVDLFRSFD